MEQFVLKVQAMNLNAKILPDRLSAKYKTLEKYRVYGILLPPFYSQPIIKHFQLPPIQPIKIAHVNTNMC